jgi:heterotetrameric sarcosine oxidase gamma subunit
MSRLSLSPRSGLEHLFISGRHAVGHGDAGVILARRGDCALATVSVRKNQLDALAARVREVLGLQLVHLPKCVIAGPIAFVWAGPGQWLAMGQGKEGAAFELRLRAAFGNLASVTDQSGGRTIIRVAGGRVREALAKGVPIDLHPNAFRPGDAAVTTVANIAAQVWQVDDIPTYEFIIFRSFAVAFWTWLTAAAAEFGVLVTDDVG